MIEELKVGDFVEWIDWQGRNEGKIREIKKGKALINVAMLAQRKFLPLEKLTKIAHNTFDFSKRSKQKKEEDYDEEDFFM